LDDQLRTLLEGKDFGRHASAFEQGLPDPERFAVLISQHAVELHLLAGRKSR